MYKAHVFLGPSLDLKTARHLFPDAHYHPPIQCGDIIRLLRLMPDLIVIIDGLYENTPAVWHKEILLALDNGIDVWGAASMGALRAAELYHYGMQGFGRIFQGFQEGTLGDDDEVAVLHLGEEGQFAAINDAMVNIRATCQRAWEEQILTLEAKNTLLNYCKTQFYPYRSLSKAIQHLSKTDAAPYLLFSQWLEKHGLIDQKKEDAASVLRFINGQRGNGSRSQIARNRHLNSSKTMTCFLRELILFANTTPFSHQADWLPDIEKHLQALHQRSPMEYMLLAEVVSFLQKLAVFSSADKQAIHTPSLIDYIKNNHLYSPAADFFTFQNHPRLLPLYGLICQAVCLLHLTNEQLEADLPALIHYYDLPANLSRYSSHMLKIILVLIASINSHMTQTDLQISPFHLRHHLKQIKNWRQYTQTQFHVWFHDLPINRKVFILVLKAYLMASSVYALNTSEIHYYQWIYDGYTMCYAIDIPS